jgi:hypothetical protein
MNAVADEFEASLAIDRAAAEAQLSSLAAFEEKMAADRNESFFFKQLYKPSVTGGLKAGALPEPRPPSVPPTAASVLEKSTPTFLSGFSAQQRGLLYTAAAGAISALSFVQAGGSGGLSVEQAGASGMLVLILGYRVVIENNKSRR